MIQYKLTIVKIEDDPEYEKKLADYKEKNSGYGYNRMNLDHMEPRLEQYTRSLDVVLTEEEFKKIKSESIKVFE